MRWRILSIIGVLYSVQFIPAIFIFMTLPIVLRQEGHTAATIGLVQLVGIPYIFKFLWAPLIDKFKFGRDRYKSWIVILSATHVAALVTLAFLDPSGPLIPLFIALVIGIAAVSTQDIAVDALAISLMRPDERAIGASFQNFGMYFGAAVGGFGFLYLFGETGWTAALLTQALVFSAALLLLFFVKEPARPHDAPSVDYRRALQFFKQPGMGRWLTLLVTMRLPLIVTTLPIRLTMVDQGMSTEEIAAWVGLFTMAAAGSATLLFGPLMRNLPRVLALYLVGFVSVATLIAVWFIASAFPDAIRYTIVLVWVAVAIVDIVIVRGAMDKVRPEIPGFDFSVQVAIFTLLPILTNPIAGAVMDSQGALAIFSAAVLLALVPLGVLRFWFAPLRKSATGLDGETVVSTTSIFTKDAAAILDSCKVHFTEHGISGIQREQNALLMEQMGCKVEMRAHENSIDIRIETPTDNFMTFIRDEIVEHLQELEPEAVEKIRWTGGIRVGELPSNFRILRATRRKEIFPGLIRVTLSGIDVEALTHDGIHIKLMMPEKRGRTPAWPTIAENGGISWPQGEDKLHARFVTIRSIRTDEREIDVDVAHHDGGLISDWAALEGDEKEVGVMGPGGDPHLPVTENILLAADYTGLPALARLLESVDGQATGHVFAAAPSQAILDAYLPPSTLQVTALDPETFSDAVVKEVEALAKGSVSYAWFAGDFTAAQALRPIFKDDFGLPRERQFSVAYWRKGVPGHSSHTV